MIELSLDCKLPTTNHIYGRRKGGGMYLKAKGRKLKKAIKEIAEKKKHDWKDRHTELEAHWYYFAHWYTLKGKIRKRDITNVTKLLEDGLFDGLGLDDSQVFKQVKYKVNTTEKEGFEVVLKEYVDIENS